MTSPPAEAGDQCHRNRGKFLEKTGAKVHNLFQKLRQTCKVNDNAIVNSPLPSFSTCSTPLVVLVIGETRNLLNLVSDYGRWGPISAEIFERLDIRSVLNLNKTCRALSNSFKNYRHHNAASAWNINHQLKHFVKDPVALRRLIAEANGIISGIFALNFFLPSTEALPNDEFDITLDIWLQNSEVDPTCASRVISLLCDGEGYRNTSTTKRSSFETSLHIRQIDCLVPEDNFKVIRVVETDQPPLYALLKSVSTTHLLNIITTSTAYSLYPRQTFISRRIQYINVKYSRTPLGWLDVPNDAMNLPRLIQHVERVEANDWYGCQHSPFRSEIATASLEFLFEPWAIHGTRALQDSKTWRITLDTEGVIDPQSSVSEMEQAMSTSSWSSSDPYHCGYYEGSYVTGADLQLSELRHPCLKHVYLCGSGQHPARSRFGGSYQFSQTSKWMSWPDFLVFKLTARLNEQCINLGLPRVRYDAEQVTLMCSDTSWRARTNWQIWITDRVREWRGGRRQLQFFDERESIPKFQCYDHMVPVWFEEWKLDIAQKYRAFLLRTRGEYFYGKEYSRTDRIIEKVIKRRPLAADWWQDFDDALRQ